MKNENFENILKDLIREEEDRKFLNSKIGSSEPIKKSKLNVKALIAILLGACLVAYVIFQNKPTDQLNKPSKTQILSPQLAAQYEFPKITRTRGRSISSRFQEEIKNENYDNLEKELIKNKDNLSSSDQLILCHIWLQKGKFKNILNYINTQADIDGQFKDEFQWVKFCALFESGSPSKVIESCIRELSTEYRIKARMVINQ